MPDFLQDALAGAGGAAYAQAAHGGQFGGHDNRVPGYGGNANDGGYSVPQQSNDDEWFS